MSASIFSPSGNKAAWVGSIFVLRPLVSRPDTKFLSYDYPVTYQYISRGFPRRALLGGARLGRSGVGLLSITTSCLTLSCLPVPGDASGLCSRGGGSWRTIGGRHGPSWP